MHIEIYFNHTGKLSAVPGDYDVEKFSKYDASKHHTEREFLPPLPPPPKRNVSDQKEKSAGPTVVARIEEDDIFVGEGTDYAIPNKEDTSPLSQDMEESPRLKEERGSYFDEPAYGPVVPPASQHDWQQTVSFYII